MQLLHMPATPSCGRLLLPTMPSPILRTISPMTSNQPLLLALLQQPCPYQVPSSTSTPTTTSTSAPSSFSFSRSTLFSATSSTTLPILPSRTRHAWIALSYPRFIAQSPAVLTSSSKNTAPLPTQSSSPWNINCLVIVRLVCPLPRRRLLKLCPCQPLNSASSPSLHSPQIFHLPLSSRHYHCRLC